MREALNDPCSRPFGDGRRNRHQFAGTKTHRERLENLRPTTSAPVLWANASVLLPGWRGPGADGEGGWVEHLAAVADPGAIGDGFYREGFVVARVEGELPDGPVSGPKGVGAQRDAAYPGVLETEGVVYRVGGAGQEDGVRGGSGRVRLRRVAVRSA